ncbi:MAG: heavy-metal-associated domain-containing protein, partial [Chloroflexi bacterium]|nr:heavy-metal-associated domain-containing protein [Chloroflexota bacterium]
MTETLQLPITGMDCAECAGHVRLALAGLPGVDSVEVFLTSEKATIHFDPARVGLPAFRKAVAGAGYSVPEAAAPGKSTNPLGEVSRTVLTLFGIVFGVVL